MAKLKSHWDVLASIDFTTIEVWTTSGLVTFYLLFVMAVAMRLLTATRAQLRHFSVAHRLSLQKRTWGPR